MFLQLFKDAPTTTDVTQQRMSQKDAHKQWQHSYIERGNCSSTKMPQSQNDIQMKCQLKTYPGSCVNLVGP
jgi:hypothetical protein